MATTRSECTVTAHSRTSDATYRTDHSRRKHPTNMPTFEQLLMDSMPLAAADTAASTLAFSAERLAYDAGSPIPDLLPEPVPAPVSDSDAPVLFDPQSIIQPMPEKRPFLLSGSPTLAPIIQVLSRGQSYKVDTPTISDYKDPQRKNIWAWEHDGAEPSKIANIWCRVASKGYQSHLVLEALHWGVEDESAKGTFWKLCRVKTMSNIVYDLPLTNEYMNFKAAVRKGTILADQTPIWRLYSEIDQSLVMAFVYKLRPDGTTGHMTQSEIDFLGKEFMPVSQAGKGFQAAVNRAIAVGSDDPRVIVILSLTVCKQRSDFEPIDIVGMGRLFPHILVMSNAPLAKIEASVLYDRPDATTHKPDAVKKSFAPNPEFIAEDPSCCNQKIGCAFVSDANDYGNSSLRVPGPLPFWGNMFGYHMLDAYGSIQDETLRMVRTDKTSRRSDDSGLVIRHVVMGDPEYKSMLKFPLQGEFDNIHMAPTMNLTDIDHVHHFVSPLSGIDVPMSSLDLGQIVMAPFCSHDCFHTHWRWGASATAKQSLGFDQLRPHAVVGAPLVPCNQDIRVWLRAANKMTYHATVQASTLDSGVWNVIMHHGSAYALDITSYVKLYLAQFSIDTFSDGEPDFYSAAGLKIQSINSLSLFYWKLRWRSERTGDRDAKISERITVVDLRGARDL